MAFTQRIHDTFTDGFVALSTHTPDQGGAWTSFGTSPMGVFSNQIYADAGPSYSLNGQTMAPKQAAEITVKSPPAQPRLILRGGWDGSNATGYVAYAWQFGYGLMKLTGTGYTTTDITYDLTPAFAANDVFRAEIDDSNNITLFKNGVSFYTVNDGTYPTGKVGLGVGGGGAGAADDFYGYDEATSPPPPPPPPPTVNNRVFGTMGLGAA